MLLDTARGYVRQFARNAGSSAQYKPEDVDRAILLVGNRFCRKTKCLIKTTPVAVAQGNASVDLAAVAELALFRPERLIGAYVVGAADPLELAGWEDLNRAAVETPASGRPTKLAWDDPTTAAVYPTPDAAYTLKIRWWQPFASWVPGSDASAVTLNLPDDYLAEILPYGPPAVLQHNEPEHKFAQVTWAKYLEYEKEMTGAGSLGGKVIQRQRAAW